MQLAVGSLPGQMEGPSQQAFAPLTRTGLRLYKACISAMAVCTSGCRSTSQRRGTGGRGGEREDAGTSFYILLWTERRGVLTGRN